VWPNADYISEFVRRYHSCTQTENVVTKLYIHSDSFITSNFTLRSEHKYTSYVYWTVHHLYSCVKRKKTNLMASSWFFSLYETINIHLWNGS